MKIHYGSQNGTVYVALVDGVVETERDLIKLLEFAKKTHRPLIIVAQDFSSEALTSLVVNKLKLNFWVSIRAVLCVGSAF